MSKTNPELMPGGYPFNEEVPQPLYELPHAIVEGIYPDPTTIDLPDIESARITTEYLCSRFKEPEGTRTRVVWVPTGRTLPKVEEVVVGTRAQHAWQKREGYVLGITPKIAVGCWIASAVLANIVPAVGDAVDEARQGVYNVESTFGWNSEKVWHPSKSEITVLKTPIVVKRRVGIENTPGSAEVDRIAIEEFDGEVNRLAKKGAAISVEVTSLSSDDAGSDATFGVLESPEQDMADDRMRTWSEAVREQMPGVKMTTNAHQDVLTPRQLRKLKQLVSSAGYNGSDPLTEAVRDAENGNGTPQLRRFVAKNITKQRGVILKAKIQNPSIPVTRVKKGGDWVAVKEKPPVDPDRDYIPFLIPLPWMRRRRRVVVGEKDIKGFRLVPGKEIWKPEILHEEIDQEWLRIRPEAIQEDKTLCADAWAYTRKYEHLLRENRIKYVMRAWFKDAKDNDASLRIMFVDHEPQKATLEAYQEVLIKFAAMQGGKISKNVTGIFVSPSEDAGLGHRDPKRMGPGLDEQFDENTLGVIFYPLHLVEMHMPTEISSDNLVDILGKFAGPLGVLAHEVGGHGTDMSEARMRVKKVWSRDIPNAHVIEGDPRARRMMPLQGKLRKLVDPANTTVPKFFDITYEVPDRDGKLVAMETRVSGNDPRLSHAREATIVGFEPTEYAGENVSEHYAETAASVVTGLEIPFKEAGVNVGQYSLSDGRPANFAKGYFPDVRAQRIVTDSLGAIAGSLPVEFKKRPSVAISLLKPEDDALTRGHMIRTRRSRMPRPEDLLAILVRYSVRSAE